MEKMRKVAFQREHISCRNTSWEVLSVFLSFVDVATPLDAKSISTTKRLWCVWCMWLTESVSLTRKICLCSSASSSNVAWAMMEKTKINPCPFFMYRSRIAVNCSVPAVSRISSMHWWPSTSTCFRYESSMVGSYRSTNTDCTNWTVCLWRIHVTF